jgi:L-alanine-DL-glutamate epimerase-like enolase superfamily enzyme
MEISSGVRTLTLAETFTIARGSTVADEVVWAEIRHDGHVGRGEGAPDDHYGESVAACRAFVDGAGDALGDDPFALEAIEARLRAKGGSVTGCCAVECALHDLVGKLVGQPTWRLLGLADRTPETSYTIGIDSIAGTADRARRAAEAGYRRLKVKLGGEGDLERLEAIRAVCDLPLRVDANEGWSLDEARSLLPTLVGLGVELIEQPFPAGERDAFRALRDSASGIPLIVDEGCHTLRDVADVATYADGVNLKLAKTGGIREAVRMIHAARALGLVVMLGCMIESSVGISASAQFASLCDFVDLDGHLLISDDPAEGLGFEAGRIVLSQRPGLGVEPRA